MMARYGRMTSAVVTPDSAPSRTETMILAIAAMLDGLDHVAVGARSPIPGSAAHLAQTRSGGRLRVSILGSRKHSAFTDGARELFDCAGQGRIDAFFLSGGQIDGQANINLVGVGDIAKYPRASARFPGSFGSAYLYFVVPRVILFHQEHSPRTLVRRVDFVSAPGISPPGVYRPGGPHALVTSLGVFRFDRKQARFALASTHPGVSREDIHSATGFDYDEPDTVSTTPGADAATLTLLRSDIAHTIADTYPAFAAREWGVGHPDDPAR
jgi:glutaconate CoA-transferase subunit B